MKVLVTGSNGFIGTHLCEALLERGHEVRGIDRRFPKIQGIEWIEGDLRWIGDCDAAVKGVDAVMHLGSRISVDESMDFIQHYFEENFSTTVNILTSMRKHNVTQIVHTSSCEVYGNNSWANEESPCNPTSAYAASKYAAERTALAFKNHYPEMQLCVIRPFNAFGPRQKPFQSGAMIPTFILQALKGETLKIHGEGNQVRDYLYVKDTALAEVIALEKGLEGIYNVASGHAHRVKDVAELIVSKIGRGNIEHIPDPRADSQMSFSLGDSTKFREATSWLPNFSFEQGLDQTIGYFGMSQR